MQDTLDQIPPEAWPLIDLLFNLTMAIAAIWFVVTVFVVWRRRASNLTPVLDAQRKSSAQPDFLNIDHGARKEAIERGAAYGKALDQRDADQARKSKSSGPMTLGQRIAAVCALLMSLFTLATMILGSIYQVSRMGEVMQEYSSSERMTAVIERHPVAFVVASLVVILHIFFFIKSRKWEAR